VGGRDEKPDNDEEEVDVEGIWSFSESFHISTRLASLAV
jgi:hypothetical protein